MTDLRTVTPPKKYCVYCNKEVDGRFRMIFDGKPTFGCGDHFIMTTLIDHLKRIADAVEAIHEDFGRIPDDNPEEP